MSLAGETAFSFAGERGVFTLQLVLDSEKEKVDRWKSWGGAVQPGVGVMLI